MFKKRFLTYALWGGVFYWGWKYFLMENRVAETRLAKQNALVLPTDSMLPGSTIPAAQGIVKEGNHLKIMGS